MLNKKGPKQVLTKPELLSGLGLSTGASCLLLSSHTLGVGNLATGPNLGPGL